LKGESYVLDDWRNSGIRVAAGAGEQLSYTMGFIHLLLVVAIVVLLVRIIQGRRLV
jgi:Tfp pilus assembly protein PilN